MKQSRSWEASSLSVSPEIFIYRGSQMFYFDLFPKDLVEDLCLGCHADPIYHGLQMLRLSTGGV